MKKKVRLGRKHGCLDYDEMGDFPEGNEPSGTALR